MTQHQKTFGGYLKEKRQERGLSQNKVGRLLGYSNGQIVSNWEREECHPPLRQLKEIARLYQIENRELLHRLVQEHEKVIEQKLFQNIRRKNARNGLRSSATKRRGRSLYLSSVTF